MNRLMSFALVFAVLGLFVFGHRDSRTFGADEKQSPEPRKVSIGEEFTIVVESTPSTGYLWRLAEQPDPNVVKSLGMKFEPPPRTGLVGAPGKEVWTFRAEGAGQTVIRLEYVRPWEKGKPPARTETQQVIVE